MSSSATRSLAWNSAPSRAAVRLKLLTDGGELGRLWCAGEVEPLRDTERSCTCRLDSSASTRDTRVGTTLMLQGRHQKMSLVRQRMSHFCVPSMHQSHLSLVSGQAPKVR